MFEASEEIAGMVEALYAACSPLGRGDTLTREAIRGVVGCEPNTLHWQYVVAKVRRRMESERGISMWPVYEVGLKLCTVREQIELAGKRQRKAARQLRRGERSLKALDGVAALTTHQRRVRAAALESLRVSRLQLQREARASEAALSPTPTLPRLRRAEGA